MNKSLIGLAIALTGLGISAVAAKPGKPIHVLSTKRYLFHFRLDKNLVGAKVEVWDECNTPVCSEMAAHTRNIIDFFELPAGRYTIRITKEKQEFFFAYVNKE
jgi:hypothetical protein